MKRECVIRLDLNGESVLIDRWARTELARGAAISTHSPFVRITMAPFVGPVQLDAQAFGTGSAPEFVQ